MPELPEVETIARAIRERYLGKEILRVFAWESRIYKDINANEFASRLSGRRINAVHRVGKYLYFDCGDCYPIFHLGMSGIFLQSRTQSKYPQHIHLEIHFKDGSELCFQDVRKFGKIKLSYHPPQFPELGVEPLSEEFTLHKFSKMLNLKAVRIKNFLMDQSRVAGIGNIYASEALFRAGIHPLRESNSLNREESEKLYLSIREVLREAIERFGTTYSAYRTVTGETGENQNFLNVYQRNGLPCPVCGSEIQKIIVNSRSTFFCENCQR
ncbi:MAG: DNA-formamidopyrimidine glycosylase [Calditrichia bacterium]